MRNGFSVLEVILAVALFMIFSTGAVTTVIQSYNANRLGTENTVASQFAAEGIEAVKSIKNRGYANLTNFNAVGLQRNNPGNYWEFKIEGTNNTLVHNSSDNYIRTVKLENVNRDGSGNIVTSGGTLDPDTKKITSTVTWNFNSARPETTTLITYLSDWRKPITPERGGILVYGDGGTSSDTIKYKLLDTSGNWGAAQPAADIDTGTTNRALRVARVFASSTRNEKILISKHYNGSTQYIYAQVFNGTSWTTPQLLSNWNATTFINARNFEGAYLSNGNFMVVYSDNTTTPKMSTWNSSSWSPQSSTTIVGGIPVYIVARARPGTNEVMMATFDQANDTNTAYYNGSTWSATTEHSAAAPTNTKEHIDFAWSSQNALKGALVYPAAGTDNTQNLKIWTANGSGGGSWSGSLDAPTTGGRLGPVDIDARASAEEFMSCQKNANNKIICFQAITGPGWNTPTNNTLTNGTQTGIQRSYNFAYETSGSEGIVVYSDNTSIPKLRKYVSSANSFDSTPISLNTLGNTLATVRARPNPDTDDIFVLMATNNTLYSIEWDGTNNQMYTTAGRAFTTQGTNGSSSTDFWYDFTWDKN